MNLEERVVAAEVASRRADGPGVIEVQSQLRSDVAGQGLGPGTQWSGRPVRPGSRGVRRPGADRAISQPGLLFFLLLSSRP